MDKITKIYTMEADAEKEMILMVRNVKERFTKNSNKPFVSAELFDGVKAINVNFFDETVEAMASKKFEKGSIIKIKLTYGSNGFYNQSGWCLNEDPTITESDFINKAPIDSYRSFNWLLKQVEEVDSNPEEVGPYKSISYLTRSILEKNADAFKKSSAAVSMHHNYISGLLYHTSRMVAMAQRVCEVYKTLDEELLVCAAALHDIGKISCYKTDDIGDAEITVEGRLLAHSVVGIIMVHEAAKECICDSEKIQMLEHMLASHHGKKEWDAITTPAFPEAEALHLIDMMDSRINMFEEAYKEQEIGTISKEKVWGLENSYIYKPMSKEG